MQNETCTHQLRCWVPKGDTHQISVNMSENMRELINIQGQVKRKASYALYGYLANFVIRAVLSSFV